MPIRDTIIHSRRGQTLVEALIALSVLTVGFIGIVTLLNRSFELNRTTTDDTQATYLASEGIELAKNLIDYDVYYGFGQSSSTIDWGCSFGLTTGQRQDYALAYDIAPLGCSPSAAQLPTIPNNTTDRLYIDPSTELYSYDVSGIATDFTRDVYITAVSPYEFDVQSVVGWTNEGIPDNITLEDHFYNWYP